MIGQSNSSKFATCDVDDYPFGTQVWKLNEDDRNMTLNLNGCYDDWQFNCQDGSCIDSAARWVRSWHIQARVKKFSPCLKFLPQFCLAKWPANAQPIGPDGTLLTQLSSLYFARPCTVCTHISEMTFK